MKLATLALKTLYKPIANRLKKDADLHPKFRQLIINIGQANHRFFTNMQRRSYGHATNVEIQPLNEEKAVQVAADLIGELFVLSVVAGAALIFGVQRNARSKAKEEEIRKQEIEEMKQQMQTVKQYLDDQIKQQMQTVKQDLEDLMKQQMKAMKQDLNDLYKEVETLNQQTRD